MTATTSVQMKFTKTIWPAFLLITGCGTPYGLKNVGEDARFRQPRSSAVTDGRLSENSLQFMQHHGLGQVLESSTKAAIDSLLEQFSRQPTRSAAFTLAELCYMEGSRHSPESDNAGRACFSAAIFAHAFLFDESVPGQRSPVDPRNSTAREIYNRALSRTLARHPLDQHGWSQNATLDSLVGPVRIVEQQWKLPWSRSAVDRFESAFRYEVTGIEHPARQDGLGVPLIAIRSDEALHSRGETGAFQQPITTQALPATLCVLFDGSVVDAIQKHSNALSARVHFVDPVEADSIEVAGRQAPLEFDIAAPLAYSIEHAPRLSGFKGFLNTESWGDRHGLFMAHPYQRGKIPVVFVYGLTGKPTTWTLMYNHLVSNETLRRRFQFWYFMYPTGNPVLYSAAELRGQLIKARKMFDPNGNDPAFNQMVIIGHSMGGLVTRLQVTDSGDKVWNAVMHRPFDSIEQDDARRDLVRSVFFFKSHPFVSRVVFMATPHRGSALADSQFARNFSSRVQLSEDVRLAGERIMDESTATTMSSAHHAPTAVQSLSAENPVLLAVDQIPIPHRIKYHSIIANRSAANQSGGTDSIVPYTSSHLEGAVSETIIHSKHGCTRNPDAIREVERILQQHLAEIDGPSN